MESSVDRVIMIANAVGVAAYAAITLGYVALHYLGFSCEQVRGGAMTAAILVAALIAVDFLGRKQRKAK